MDEGHDSTGPDGAIGDALMEALFTQSPNGLYLFDPELRLVRFRTSVRGLARGSAEDPVGRGVAEAARGFDVSAIEEALRLVLQTGEALTGFEQRGHPRGAAHPERVISISAFRLQDPATVTLGVAATVVDITARVHSQERLEIQHRADTTIGTTLDTGRTAQELAEVAVPVLADTVAVDVLESVLRGEAPAPGPVDSSLPLRRSGYRSLGGPDREGAFPSGAFSSVSFPTPYGQSLTDLRPRLIRDLGRDDDWLRHDHARAEAILSAHVHSMMVVPLMARDVLLGLVGFYRWDRAEPFDEQDLALAQALTDRAALSLDNARRYTRERNTAAILQRSLLPVRLPTDLAVETAHAYLPGSPDGRRGSGGSGGDWFDVIPLSGARVALVVGDVTGHGIHAATTMGRLRTAVHAYAALDLAPDELLARLDDLVLRLAEEHPPDSDDFPLNAQPTGACCLYVEYDPVTRRCSIARAGHMPPIVAHPDGSTHLLDVAAGPPLGLGGLPFTAADVELPDGSLLALFTDGLVVSRERDLQVSLDRLQRVLAHPGRPLADTCDAAAYALLPRTPEDDAVLLLGRARGITPDRIAAWTLPPDPSIVATARTLADRQLVAWELEDLRFSTELVVSELVTNAIRYSTGPAELRLILDRTLICEVSDNSSSSPHLRHAQSGDEGGRGLFLVAQLTERWGTRHALLGKTIWTEQALPDTPR